MTDNDTIDTDAWREELERLSQADGDPGLTTQELCEQFGHHEAWVRARLRRMIDEGTVVAGWANRRQIDGTMHRRPVFRPVGPAPKTRRHK